MSILTPRFVIYKATSPSGKSYIGKTVNGLRRRKKQHYKAAKRDRYNNIPFYRALNKYGDEIKWEILKVCKSDEELRKSEIELIAEHGTYENGYNCTLGGEGHSGFKQSEETIKKRALSISKALTGRKLSDQHKEALRQAKLGTVSNAKGTKRSDESKARISKAQEHNIKPLMCMETGEVFRTSRDAAEAFNVDRANLLRHLKRKPHYKTLKGLTFKYLENNNV